MSWSRDHAWSITKYTDLRFPSNNPIVLENDLHLFIQKSAKLLVLAQGNRTLHQVPLREPYPIIKFRDVSFYVSLKINDRDIRFRFRARSTKDAKDITNAISQFTPVQQHISKSRGNSHSNSPFSQDICKQSLNDFDVFGSTSSNDSLSSSSPRCTESPLPYRDSYMGSDYNRVSDYIPYTSTMNRGTQTDNVPKYSAMSPSELEEHLKKLLDSPSFQNLVANTKIALSKINNKDSNKVTTKSKKRGKTASSRSSSQTDSILHRF